MACGDVLSLEDLQTAKKHQIFEAEVITGKAGGVAGGATIGTATNPVTGQVQITLPEVISDAQEEFDAQLKGMGYARVGTFKIGATITNARQTLLWDIADGGDGQEYGWSGMFQKIVPADSTPASTGGIAVGAWMSRFDPELRQELTAFSGSLTPVSAWDTVPAHSGDLEVPLNAQSQAILNRQERQNKMIGMSVGTIQSRLDATPVGGTVVLQTGDENISAGGLNNDFGKNIDVRNGRLFTPSGVQVSTYSEGQLRFVTGEQYLHFIHKKMTDADGFTTSMKSNFVWSGDSTTEDVGGIMPPDKIAYYYAQRYGIADTVHVNLGHSSKALVDWGNTYIDTEWATYNAADCIILRWGINDPYFGKTLTEVKDALERGLAKLRAAKTVAQQSIVIMAPNSTADTPNGRDEKWYEQLNGVLRAAAKKHMCCFFDTYGLFQESRRGAGVWLDDPYGDGRGIHPDLTFSSVIYHQLLDIIYGPCTAIGGTTNLFSNNGSSLQFVSHAWGPATYHRGISFWRTNPSDAAWPLNGVVKVERYVDGLVKMSLMGFSDDGKQITMSRYGRIIGEAEAWTDWRGKRNPLPALQNGWTLGGSRQNTYIKSDDGVVTVTATLVAGTTTAGTVLLTMPVNYRPEFDLSYIVCGTESGVARIDVSSLNGNMTIRSMTGTILSINITYPSKV